MKIELTPWEIMTGAQVGVQRMVHATSNGWKHKHGADPTKGWQYNIEGALAEMALAKLLNRYWTKGMPGDADIGQRIQVRTTHHLQGSLILHDSDPGDHIYALMVGFNGSYHYKGCILGYDGKVPANWQTRTGRPCYFVRQSCLGPSLDPVRHVA